MIQAPTTILFDWDSTLVDGWGRIVNAWNEALREMGRSDTIRREDAIRLSAKPQSEIFLEVFGADEAQRGLSTFYSRLAASEGRAGMSVIDGSAELLAELHARSIPMAVVSNKKGPALRQDIHEQGWDRYFFAAVGAGDAAYDKPHPAPVLYALERRMIAPDPSVWMVGDMHSDMQAAKRAGITAVLIEVTASLGLGIEGDMTRYPPDFRVRNAKALAELVKQRSDTI